MKLIRESRLRYQKGSSEKFFYVELVELESEEDNRYLVNTRHSVSGHSVSEHSVRGNSDRNQSSSKSGTKTPEPVERERAERLFDSVVVSKVNAGFVNVDDDDVKATQDPPVTPFNHDDLIARIRKEKCDFALGRQIWRIKPEKNQELSILITSKLDTSIWSLKYSILWTLGRIGSEVDIRTLERYFKNSDEKLSSLALEAMLALTNKSHRKMVYQTHSKAEIVTPTVLEELVDTHINDETKSVELNQVLKDAYLQAWFDDALLETLRNILPKIDFSPNAFKGLRYILKMSEFRLDAETFAIAHYHLSKSNPYFYRSEWSEYHYNEQGQLHIDKELASPNAKLAHSQLTHNYLIRRQWRVLKQLGINQSPDYVRFATQLLLQYQQSDEKQAKKSEQYVYDSVARRYDIRTNHYDGYARYATFNSVLRSHNPAYNRTSAGYAWTYDPEIEFTGRGEAFPELWDRAPNYLLELVLSGQCLPVVDFALLALKDNHKYVQALSLDILVNVMVRPYPACHSFALPLIEQCLTTETLAVTHYLTLLRSQVDKAQQIAFDHFSGFTAVRGGLDVLAEVLTMTAPTAKSWFESQSERFELSPEQQHELQVRLLLLLAVKPCEDREHALWVADWMRKYAPNAAKNCPLDEIKALVTSTHLGNVVLGCELLMDQNVRWEDIPKEIFDVIESSGDEKIQSYSIALISKQSAREIMERSDELIQLLFKNMATRREAVLKTLESCCESSSLNRELIFEKLVKLLCGRTLDDDLQAMLVTFINETLSDQISIRKLSVIYSLANAKSQMAQSLIIPVIQDPSHQSLLERELSLKVWYEFSDSSTQGIRQAALDFFKRNSAPLISGKTRNVSRDARDEQLENGFLRLLGSPWADVKAFAFDFCRHTMQEDDWSPEVIVAICDNTDKEVQALGRELLQRFFNETNGKEYLIKLSQHPSQDVELFVTQFLEQFAAEDEATLLALKPYFTSVLSRVNSGRKAKNRILSFLEQQITVSSTVRLMLAEMLTRHSLTQVAKDKSRILQIMLRLKQMQADIELPITLLKPSQLRSAVSSEHNSPQQEVAELEEGIDR